MVENLFVIFWRGHIAVKGPRFPFEVTEFRVKIFFLGDHLAIEAKVQFS